MIKFSFFSFMLTGFISLAQQTPTTNCTIYGKITDGSTAEEIPFANLILFKNDTVKIVTATTDMTGNYCFKNINAGTYKLVTAYVGYNKNVVTKIEAADNKSIQVNVKLAGNQTLDEVQIVNYNQPLMDMDVKQ